MKPLRAAFACVMLCTFAASFAWAQRAKPASTPAGAVVIYRCEDAQGNLTLQNGIPCPRGAKQQRRVLQAPTAPVPPVVSPAPVAATPVPAAPVPTPAPAATTPAAGNAPAWSGDAATSNNPDRAPVLSTERLPPPALYRCTAHSGGQYLSDDGAPAERCVALQVTGIDGGDNKSGAQACEMQKDVCARIPDNELCAAWQQRAREIESVWEMGSEDQRGSVIGLRERAQKVMRDSTCAAQASTAP